MSSKALKSDFSHDELKEALFKLYSSRENTDLVIVCGNKTLKCHSFLLWARSKFFAAACMGGFKESDATHRIARRQSKLGREDDPLLLLSVLR